MNDSTLRVNFLLAIREDAWAKLDRFKAAIPDLFSNYLRLNPLERGAARRAIECPIQVYNEARPHQGDFSIEPELTDAVLDGVKTADLSIAQTEDKEVGPGRSVLMGERHIEPAFLQLVMERLWDATRVEGSRDLRIETLVRLGGPRQIVRGHLERWMGELTHEERDVAADVFRFLVTSAKTKVAQRASDLAYWTNRPPEEVLPVLEHLADRHRGRILRPLPAPPGEEGERFEIFHDVLAEAILDWRKRYEHERETDRVAKRLEEDRRKRIEAERARHHAQVNRLVRWSALALAVLAAALVVAVVFALRERGAAITEREAARSRSVAATAESQLQTDPERSLLLAREAWNVHETPEAEAALRRALGASRVRIQIPAGEGLDWAVASPDGKTVATVTNPGEVKVWSAGDGRLLESMSLGWRVLDIAYSRDGSKVVVVGDGGAVLKPLAAGTRATRLRSRRPVYAVSVSNDGKYIATAEDAGVVVWSTSVSGTTAEPLRTVGPRYMWDVEFNPRDSGFLAAASAFNEDVHLLSWVERAGHPLRRRGERATHPIEGFSSFGATMSFSGDGRFLVTAVRASDTVHLKYVSPERGPDARIWDARSGKFLHELRAPGRSRGVNDVAWSTDNRQVAVAAGKEAQVFDAASGRHRLTLRGHADWVWTTQFGPEARVVTASRDGTARIWDARSGRPLLELRGHTGGVWSADFIGRGDRILTAGGDGTARIWDVHTGRELGGHPDWVFDAAYSPDGRTAATVADDGSVRIWSLSGHRSRKIKVAGTDQATDVEFDAAGKRVLVTARSADDNDAVIVVADAHSGEILRRLRPKGRGASAAFAPNGRLALFSHDLWRPELWDVDRRRRIGALSGRGVSSGTLRGRFSPDGRKIVTGGTDGVAHLFDASTQRERYAFKGHDGVVAGAAFSPDGKLVVSYGFDGTARVWEPGRGELVALRGHNGWVTSAEFSPDGRRVVTGGADQTVRVWDAATGKPLGVVQPHAGIVYSVAFSPDGRSILTASDDQTAKITRCETCLPVDELLALAERRLERRKLTSVERREFIDEE